MLRALAVVMVMLHHIPDMLLHHVAWAERVAAFGTGRGVDLFFVISGFVITRGLYPSLTAARGAGERALVLRRFWIRRVWRIWPAAWLWLGLCLLGSFFFGRNIFYGGPGPNFRALLAGVFGYANLRFAAVSGVGTYGASFAYWSLSLEEQFYLLLPFAVLLLGRRLPLVLAAVLAAAFAVPRGPFGLALRADGLIWGVLLAIWSGSAAYRRAEPRFLRRAGIVRPLAVAGLVLVLCYVGSLRQAAFPAATGTIALLGAALVWLASYDRDYICDDALLRPALFWVGSRSYALYLVHVPLFFMAHDLAFRASWHSGFVARWQAVIAGLGGLAAVLLAAELTFRCVEQPLRAVGVRRARRPAGGGAGVLDLAGLEIAGAAPQDAAV